MIFVFVLWTTEDMHDETEEFWPIWKVISDQGFSLKKKG